MKIFLAFIALFLFTKDSFADELRVRISSNNPNDVAVFLSRLLQNTKISVDKKLNLDNKLLCKVCNLVINDVFAVIKEKTKEEIEKALHETCHKVSFVLRKACNEFVTKFGGQIVDLIMDNIPKDQICPKLGVCVSHDDPVACQLCKMVIKDVIEVIKENIEKEINDALHKACAKVSFVMRKACNEFVNQFSAQIVQLIIDNIQKEDICGKLGVCAVHIHKEISSHGELLKHTDECKLCEEMTSISNRLVSNKALLYDEMCEDASMGSRNQCELLVTRIAKKVEENLINTIRKQYCLLSYKCHVQTKAVENKVDNIIECWLCKEVMQVLSGLINKDSTAADISRALDYVCDLLPGQWRGQCVDFINMYTTMIINFLVAGGANGELCRYLMLCSSHGNIQSIAPSNEIEPCRLCKQVVFIVDRLTVDKKTEIDSRQIIEEMCATVFIQSKPQCQYLVKTFLSEIQSSSSHNLPRDQLCQRNQRCGTGAIIEKEKSIPCWICKEVMKELARHINTKSTANDIAHALKQVCHVLPKQWRKDCHKMVDRWANQIVKYLISGTAVDQICRLLTLCAVPEFSSNNLPFVDPIANIL